MFPFLRFSAVMASIIVASTAFGFALAATILSANGSVKIEISNGPRVVSPASESRETSGNRVVAGLRSIKMTYRSLDMANMPAENMQAPLPGVTHANLGQTRAVASACLMAMN